MSIIQASMIGLSLMSLSKKLENYQHMVTCNFPLYHAIILTSLFPRYIDQSRKEIKGGQMILIQANDSFWLHTMFEITNKWKINGGAFCFLSPVRLVLFYSNWYHTFHWQGFVQTMWHTTMCTASWTSWYQDQGYYLFFQWQLY